jgi:DNA-binding MarR family transcriptional regulator
MGLKLGNGDMAKTKGKAARPGAESPLDASPSHLLHRVLQLALDLYTAETGPGAITQRQYAVLTAVAHNEGLTQTDLVKSTGIDRSTLADMVARMITKGLLERERSSLDARANTVSLTEAGRAELATAKPRVDAADKRILTMLPRGKRNSFISVLRAFAAAGEEAAAAAADEAVDGRKKKKKKAEKAAKREKAPKLEKPEKKKKKIKKAA